MPKNHISLIIAFGIILLLSSCAKEGPTGPAGPATAYTGTISGHVSLYDQYGNKVFGNLDSVAIVLNNNPSNPMAFYADTVTYPNSDGLYSYSNDVTTGQYYFTADDTGYGATYINYFNFVSGNLNVDIKLSAVPTFSLTFTAYYNPGSPNDSLVINCTPDAQVRSLIIFVNGDSSTAAGESYSLSYIESIPANASQVTVTINELALTDAGYTSGSLIYYTVFSHAVNDHSVYEDQTTGFNVYNAVSNPTVHSTIVPDP